MREHLQVKRASCSQPSEIQLQHPFRWEDRRRQRLLLTAEVDVFTWKNRKKRGQLY